MKKQENTVLAQNCAAYHEYFVTETYEAGIVLYGDEVKSIRRGGVNLKDSFVTVDGGELVLKNMHVSPYEKKDGFQTADAKRSRVLLMHRSEVIRLRQKVEKSGMTLIPLRIYLKDALIKFELGLCKGKHTYDKKEDLQKKDLKREAERQIKEMR